MQTKIVIIEDDAEEREQLAEYFSSMDGFVVCAAAQDGLEGAEAVERTKPDVVILDLVLPGLDGYGVLKRIKRSGETPCVIVLSPLSHDRYLTQAMELGADYYMLKPCDPVALKDRVKSFVSASRGREFTAAAKRYFPRNLDEKISNIFISVGIPAHIKGYQFLREAVKMAIDSPEIINSITKKLYPFVAERFSTSASKVERAIRHAIEVAWNKGKIENINNLFGIRVYGSHEKPTNGEFIALVADKMLVEGA